MSSVDRWRAGVREYKDPPFTASYPLDVIVGKVLGRAGVIGSAALVGLTIGPGFGFLLLGSVELLPAIVFIGTTAVFSLVYTSIIIGLSATSGSTTRSAALAIGYFVIFELMWDVAPLAIVWIVHGFSLPERFPDWVFIVSQVPPSAAYISTLVVLMPELTETLDIVVDRSGFDAFYATPEIGPFFLVVWLVLPLAIGYRFFSAQTCNRKTVCHGTSMNHPNTKAVGTAKTTVPGRRVVSREMVGSSTWNRQMRSWVQCVLRSVIAHVGRYVR